LDVQDGYVRLVAGDQIAGHLTIIGFGYDCNVAGLFQELTDAGPHYSMIVSQENRD
jgi:hypothetical protein